MYNVLHPKLPLLIYIMYNEQWKFWMQFFLIIYKEALSTLEMRYTYYYAAKIIHL